jgi:hypothetical protein
VSSLTIELGLAQVREFESDTYDELATRDGLISTMN